MTTFDRIEELCKERNISRRKMEQDAGIAVGSSSKWKNGLIPSQKSLQKLSEFFNVTVAYLTGESEFRSEQDAVMGRWSAQYEKDARNELGKIEAGIRIPVLGEVPCGIPLEAIELIDVDDWEEISEKLARTGKFFGLKSKGDSMSPRIQEGDVLIVRQQPDAESGDVVIAKINGSNACCKKLLKTDDGIVLQSFNPMYEPMFFSNEDIKKKPVLIIGKVIENRQKF